MTTDRSEPGHLLAGRYRLTSTIGEGGMGRVWEGVDELLDRPVAIKELSIPPHLPHQEVEVLRSRMLREARSAAQLSHPSIVTMYDVVESGHRPWIVMELVSGPPLSDLLTRDGPLPPSRVATIGAQVVMALSVAHERGVVHRDIKPGNIMLAKRDRAVLTDFGIARLEGSTNLTRTGLLVGSPGYLAPEQAHGQRANPATDMWSLGVTLFQVVEGTAPFHRESPMGTLTAIATQPPPTPTRAGPLAPVLMRMLEKDPARRVSAEEAYGMLRAVVDAGEARGSATSPAPGPTAAAGSTGAGSAASEALGSAVRATPALVGGAVRAGAHGLSRVPRGVYLVVGAILALALAIAVGTWLGLGYASRNSESGDLSAEQQKRDRAAGDEKKQDDSGPEMARHDDETGFSMDLPEGWTEDHRDGDMVYFDIPGGGYLQVDQTDDPGDNAKKDWERQESSISRNFDGYTRKGITALDEPYFDAYISAADWEFTFDGDDGRMHAVNRAFHTKEKGYALFLVSTEDGWKDNRALLDDVTESFEPAGD